jgi:peroxin-5
VDEWVKEFQSFQEQSKEWFDPKEPIQMTADKILNSVDTKRRQDERFANSQFFQFLDRLKNNEVTIEADRVVERTSNR